MSDFTKFCLILIAICLLFIVGIPLLAITIQTDVGDIKTLNQQTPVYKTYEPGALGDVVCTLPRSQKVTIRQILTSNDLPGHEQTVFTEIKAFLIETNTCRGWILREYTE